MTCDFGSGGFTPPAATFVVTNCRRHQPTDFAGGTRLGWLIVHGSWSPAPGGSAPVQCRSNFEM
jgi:methionyl-tRNA formyltransferase